MGHSLEGTDFEIVSRAHRVLSGDTNWTAVMRALNTRFGLRYSFITTGAREPGKLGAGVNSQTPGDLREVLDHWTTIDTRTPRFIRSALARHGHWVSDHHLFNAREIALSPLHNEYLRPRGTGDFLGMASRMSGCDYFFVGGLPVDRDTPAREELRRLRATVIPLIQIADLGVAWRRSRTIEDLANRGGGRPALAIDVRGRWSWISESLRETLAGHVSLSNGVPAFERRHAWTELLSTLSAFSDGPLPPVALNRSAGAPLVVTAHRVESDPLNPFASGELLAVLSVHDVPPRSGRCETVLEALGLTPAEARIAVRVGRAMTPAQVAEDLSISITTTRSTLSLVYAKLGITRQAELVRLVTLLLN